MTRFPPLPKGKPSFESGRYEDVYDAEINGIMHRWRTQRGTRKVVCYIEYDYGPETVRKTGGAPWAKLWVSASWERAREVRSNAIMDVMDDMKSKKGTTRVRA